MTGYLVEGIIFGFILSFSLGPVLFAIIETGLTFGSKKAMAIALGVLLSDVIIVFACHVFSTLISGLLIHFDELRIAAGLMFIWIGVNKLFFKKNFFYTKIDSARPVGCIQYILKGAFVNGLNPGIFILWLTLTGFYQQKGSNASIWFFCGVFTITFVFDLVKSFFSGRLISFLTLKNIRSIIRLSGLVFIIFGLIILIKNPSETFDIFTFSSRNIFTLLFLIKN